MEDTFSFGIDYGTESGRVVLVSLQSGEEVVEHVVPYQNGVIDVKLPSSDVHLGNDWALQDPKDYIDVLKKGIPAVLEKAQVDPDKIIGIGVDFTSCTILPIDRDGTPLCYHDDLRDNPHSWVKLWKHHAAQDKASQFNDIATKRNESFLPRYGGKVSAEWMLPKIWQIHDEAKDVFQRTDQFLEAGDWVVSQLTGSFVKSSCAAGYKSLWHKQEGYPDKEFLKSLDDDLEDLFETKLRGDIFPLGTRAGGLTEEMSEVTGLLPGTSVAVSVVDAHASVPAMGVVEPGKMVMAMGTSICHMILDEKEKHVDGISGVVEDGIIPGFYGYEAGQNAGGDIFNWFIEHVIPGYVSDEANISGVTVHQLLEDKASSISAGGTGLLALDWWNGNRSTLNDSDLTGLLLGMTLKTTPEEIYRALLEATALGTRKIIDAFEKQGVQVNKLYACGGLPNKNKLLMQIYADVTNREIILSDSIHTPAIGAAMFGAVSAGTDNGGYSTIVDASSRMSRVKEETISPEPSNVAVYENLYKEYVKLYDYFGLENDVMKKLRTIKS